MSDLSPLKRLFNLQELYLNSNQISDLSPLEQLQGLKKITLNDNNVSDLSPLKKLSAPEELELEENKVRDLSVLKKLHTLQKLHLGNNLISDLSPLKELYNLQKLEVSENNIYDISPLKGLHAEIYNSPPYKEGEDDGLADLFSDPPENAQTVKLKILSKDYDDIIEQSFEVFGIRIDVKSIYKMYPPGHGYYFNDDDYYMCSNAGHMEIKLLIYPKDGSNPVPCILHEYQGWHKAAGCKIRPDLLCETDNGWDLTISLYPIDSNHPV